MPQQISQKIVERMAALGRVKLTDKELHRATKNLADILDYFSTIQKIDTADTPTYDNAAGLANITRPDEASSHDICSCDDLIKSAPAVKDGHIKVPSVF